MEWDVEPITICSKASSSQNINFHEYWEKENINERLL